MISRINSIRLIMIINSERSIRLILIINGSLNPIYACGGGRCSFDIVPYAQYELTAAMSLDFINICEGQKTGYENVMLCYVMCLF